MPHLLESDYSKVYGSLGFNDGKRMIAHFHTSKSDGLRGPEELVEEALELGVDAVMPADHDTLRGVAAMIDYNDKHSNPLQIIPAEEISTSEGVHIIAVNPRHEIPFWRPLDETLTLIDAAHAQALAPHIEMDRTSLSWKDLAQHSGRIKLVEVYNAGARKMADQAKKPFRRFIFKKTGSNDRALKYFGDHGSELGIHAVGGADAHYLHDFPDAVMVYPSEVDPVDAMLTGQITIFERKKQADISMKEFLAQRRLAKDLQWRRERNMI
jgi:predicted metal-dependent phosphoesterase TrpH